MSVIDERSLDQLSELIGGDKDTLHELIETFLDEGKDIIDEMKDSLQTRNLDTLRRCAHSLKSSAQDFGAIELSELNATLESQCKNGWPENADAQTSTISESFVLADIALKRYIDT